MSIKNIPASLLDAVKDVVQEDRKKFVEEQQLHEKLVAEKMLSPKQKKHIDKNKNGKIDAHDFELLRKEEAEQIDEALPASGIKEKQRLSMMNSQELHDHIKRIYDDNKKTQEYAKANNTELPRGFTPHKSLEDTARRLAWRYGHGQMSSHYWNIIKKHAGSDGSANEAYTPDLQEEVVVSSLDIVRAIMEGKGRGRKPKPETIQKRQAAAAAAAAEKNKNLDPLDRDDNFVGRPDSPHHSTEPDKHIVVQLRVASDMKDEKGGADVKFADGKTHFVKHDVATRVLNGLDKVKPQERGMLHDHIAQSHDNLMAAHKTLVGGK